jgi:competence protein ComEC
MFLVGLAFLVGHCAIHALPVLPQIAPVPHGLIVLAATVLLALQLPGRFRHCLAALIIGVGWAWTHAAWRVDDALAQPEAVESPQVDVEIVGRIDSLIDVIESKGASRSLSFVVALQAREGSLPSRVELSWYDTTQSPRPGEIWGLSVRLRPPRGFANPGGVDYEAQLFRYNVGATGYVRADESNRLIATPGSHAPLLRARSAIAASQSEAVPDSPMLGIIQGLSVGDTQRIPSDQWRIFARTGTTHLMAISGLHIAMVAALGSWLAGWLARFVSLQRKRLTIPDIQALAGLSFAVAYCALAGMSVPTQRTLVMLSVYFATRLLRRQIDLTHGFGVALIGVLLVDPFAPLAPGFWLSFGAVAVILLANGGRLRLRAESRAKTAAREYLRLQAAITIGLLPFLIGAFGGLSLVSPLVNLIAIPLFTFAVVPSVLIGTCLLWIWQPAGAAVLQGVAWGLESCWPALQWAGSLSLATWHLPQLPWWSACLMVVGCAMAVGPGMWTMRTAGVLLCLPAVCWQPPRPAHGEFALTVLDVGQGLATVVTTQLHVLVYDAGPAFRSGRDTGEMVVLPFLYSRGVRGIDSLMMSHGDSDHVGGMQSILNGIRVERLSIGPSVRAPSALQGAKMSRCLRGEQWEWDGVRFETLHPDAEEQRGDNDSSCVLRIAGKGGSALLLGDVERAAEYRLVQLGAIDATDVVVVPHHGSRTSSTPELVGASRPRIAVVSAGYGNRWSFPKEDVVDRWQSVGAQVLKTAQSGAIEIQLAVDTDEVLTGAMRPVEYRRRYRKYWQRHAATQPGSSER